MKIAVILGAFSIGTRPINLNKIFSSERGLTGTDMCLIRVCEELKALGNDVYMFSVFSEHPAEHKGIKVFQFEQRNNVVDNSFDCIISINEPNVLMDMAQKPIRLVYMMLNDFSFINPGFDDFVDSYVGVCDEHTEHMKRQCPKPEKWTTVPLGCDPDEYRDERMPGRVIWCSSADRGLHWLLSKWSVIKRAVPCASLRVFYHFNYISVEGVEESHGAHPHVTEMAQRVRYIRNAMRELKTLDVEHVGSVSRERMKEEQNKASVFAFPCDTVAFSEGFSVSTLEAHASYTVPVITSADCLGGIYKDSGCIMVDAPVSEHLDEFTDKVIEALTNQKLADEVIQNCRQFSQQHTWKQTAEKLEHTIKGKLNG
jgi:glycosyltransferase involved in cell wall biosynthesis